MAAGGGDSDVAAAALRRRVFALVRASRPDGRACRSRLSDIFARFSAACRALVASASTTRSSSSSERLAEKEQSVWAELERLNALVTCADSAAALELPFLVARCFTMEPTSPRVVEQEPARRCSRKRSRSDGMPLSSSPRQGDEETSADRRTLSLWTTPLPTELSHALGNLLVVLALHHAALVRLNTLLVAIGSDTSGLCGAIRLVLGAGPIVLPGSWRRVLRQEDGPLRSQGGEPQEFDSHALVECIVGQLVQFAFPNVSGETEGMHDDDNYRLPARAAVSVLEALCCSSPSLPLAQQIPSLRVVIDAFPSNRQSTAQPVRFSDEPADKTRDTAAASERGSSQSTAFLSGVLYVFLCRAASERGAQANGCDGVIDSVLCVLPPLAAIQVVRRFLTHDAETNDPSLAAGEVSNAAHGSNDNPSASRSVRGTVFRLIRRYSSSGTEFARLALTLAHEIAEDGVLHGKPWLLGHALELVATVAMSPLAISNCYKDWFQNHFGNDTAQNLDEPKTAEDALCCIKFSKSRTSGSCRLIHGKSHLQLVCLFLLEFDRRGAREGINEAESTVDRVIWTSAHVMTHLSVLKSFQGQQSAENALVINFCAEARVCYTTLLSRELAGRELPSDKRSPSALDQSTRSTSKRLSQFSSEARAVVDENVAYYKKHQSLSPQLRQWKTFQYLKWKSDILPCCLDVAIDESWTVLDASDGKGDVVDQIHFVFALARANMVPADDYARFLAKIQSWVDQTRLSIAQDMQRKRQRDVASNLRRSIKRLRGIRQRTTIVAGKPRKSLISECLTSASECIFAYLDSRAAHAEVDNAADEQTQQERMLLLWKSAFMEVLSAIGVDGLDEFYGFQVSLLVKFSKAATRWSSSSSERNTFLEELSSIALTHRPSTDASIDPRHGVEWIACFAGVVAGMFATTSQLTAPVISADVAREFSFIESAIAARKRPWQELLVEKTLLSTCFLRALASFQAVNPQDIYIACTRAFSTHVVDLWAWTVYRVWRESRWIPSTEAAVSIDTSRGRTERDTSDWISLGQHALLQTQWLQTFQARWALIETAKNMLDYEFRCGSALRGLLDSALHAGGAEWTPASTLQRHLEIVNATGTSQPPLYWCQWLIDEIVSLATAQSCEDVGGRPSKSDTEVERDAHEGLQAAILLLNDLVHRSLQSSGQSNDVKRGLMSQWLGLAAQKLSSIDEQAVVSKQMVYQYSSEILNVLRDIEASRLPQLQPADNNHLMELLRVTASDLSQPRVSEYVRRFLLRPLLELVRHREWSMEKIAELPVALLVEWGRIPANGSKERQIETQNRHLFATIDWLHQTMTIMTTSISDNVLGHSRSSSPLSSIFTTVSYGLKFLVKATGFVLESSSNSTCVVLVDDGGDQQRLSVRLRHMAEAALAACSGTNWDATGLHQQAPTANGGLSNDGEAVYTLVPWLFKQWREHVTQARPRGNPLLFQLFLLHLAATLCTQSTHASKILLEPLTDDEGLRAMFVVLVASVASDSGQLSAIIARHSSLWVNSFPEVALTAISRPLSHHKATKRLSTNTPVFEETLGGTTAFRTRVAALVSVVLTYGADHHVDLLIASLKPRVIAQWPHLEALTARLSVLSPDDDMAM